ncbi:MAG: TlpA family protein disulfide reductase [Tenuifilaceae bacterium]
MKVSYTHKKILLLLAILYVNLSFGQEAVPSVHIKSIDGKTKLSSELMKTDMVTVISFWATWCKPCLQEMEAISEVFEEWNGQVNFSFVAISIDDSRSSGRVKSFVAGKGWPFEFYLDSNQDLKRAMNITDIPFTVIVNKEGKIVYRHVSYSQGGERQLFEEIKKISGK